MNFDFWQRWGIELNDVSFANAWVSLGLAGHRAYDPAFARSVSHLNTTSWSVPTIPWRFPRKETSVVGTPEQWSRAWITAPSRIARLPARLRVMDPPPDEPILPWYRILSAASPALGAVSLEIEAPRAQLQIAWPLRIGCLADSGCNLLDQVKKQWPSSEMAETIRLDRDKANCDLLVFKGSARELLRELLERPFGVKANVLILQNDSTAEWGETEALLTSAMGAARKRVCPCSYKNR